MQFDKIENYWLKWNCESFEHLNLTSEHHLNKNAVNEKWN